MVKRQTFALLVFACAQYDIDNRNRLVNLAGRNRLVILADDDDEVNDDAIIVVLI